WSYGTTASAFSSLSLPYALPICPQDVAGPAFGVEEVRQVRERCVDLLAQVGHVEFDDVSVAAEVVVPDPVEDLRLRQDRSRVAQDRKSTRLNSSHVKISYAVCCL